jgi:hypothetical protein
LEWLFVASNPVDLLSLMGAVKVVACFQRRVFLVLHGFGDSSRRRLPPQFDPNRTSRLCALHQVINVGGRKKQKFQVVEFRGGISGKQVRNK